MLEYAQHQNGVCADVLRRQRMYIGVNARSGTAWAPPRFQAFQCNILASHQIAARPLDCAADVRNSSFRTNAQVFCLSAMKAWPQPVWVRRRSLNRIQSRVYPPKYRFLLALCAAMAQATTPDGHFTHTRG